MVVSRSSLVDSEVEVHCISHLIHKQASLYQRKFERITPTLRDDLHWLPVRERIIFKLCSIIFKLLRSTFWSCAFQLQLVQVAVTYILSLVAICIKASASLPHLQFWTTQLCCLCSKTVDLSANVTSGSYTYIDIIL